MCVGNRKEYTILYKGLEYLWNSLFAGEWILKLKSQKNKELWRFHLSLKQINNKNYNYTKTKKIKK